MAIAVSLASAVRSALVPFDIAFRVRVAGCWSGGKLGWSRDGSDGRYSRPSRGGGAVSPDRRTQRARLYGYLRIRGLRPVNVPTTSISLDRLLKLRVVVARVGEMDLAKWWNTQGQLGPLGAASLRRGLPRTHYFAQARSVFAVAAHRCAELFDPPASVTLWRLPEDIEEAFDARWQHWIDAATEWDEFFATVAATDRPELVYALHSLGLVDAGSIAAFETLKSSVEDRSVPLPAAFSGTDADVTLLALAFAQGSVGALAVPYARIADR